MPSLLRLWARILTCTVLLLKLNHVLTFPTESELSLHNTSKFLRAAQQALQRLHLCYFTAVLVTQALLPRKLPKPCTAERLLSPGSILSAMPTAAVHQNCPWDLKEDSPHQQPDFVSDIVSFQQSHILTLREQLLPILATPFRRHTWCSCVVCWEDRTAISKCLWLCSFQLKNT